MSVQGRVGCRSEKKTEQTTRLLNLNMFSSYSAETRHGRAALRPPVYLLRPPVFLTGEDHRRTAKVIEGELRLRPRLLRTFVLNYFLILSPEPVQTSMNFRDV